MAWEPNGDLRCDSCPKTYPGDPDVVLALERATVAGWGFWDGETMGGATREHLVCPACRREQHTTSRTKSTIENDAFPGMEKLVDESVGEISGFQSR